VFVLCGLVRCHASCSPFLQKTKHVHYPITRYLRLVEAISRDVSSRLRVIVSARRPMQLPYDQFDEFAKSANELFLVWEEQFGNFHQVVRDLAKKRNQKNLPLRYTIETNPLKVHCPARSHSHADCASARCSVFSISFPVLCVRVL
jgi:hypothetical protein